MKEFILSVIAAFILLLCGALWWELRRTQKTNDPITSDSTALKLEATKPALKYAKYAGEIGPVKIYELTTVSGDKIYVAISNAAGVTASISR